ncbi:MAG: class I SAM-dependent methyltransferase [Nitrospira sp.]|nr:class I SAM-dependent methyltransferase [Nitrospira sp.]
MSGAIGIRSACGTYDYIVGSLPALSREIGLRRSSGIGMPWDPCIPTVAQFETHRGKTVLEEVGVGAGTDHLQWARAGAVCYGVDLTQRAIETTRAHLACTGWDSTLQRIDAETLPFPDGTFDALVYSWGVIHHSAHQNRSFGKSGEC